MTHESDHFGEHELDELVSMNEAFEKLDKQAEHRLSSAQQQAALRALKGAGVGVDTVINVREAEPKVTQQAPDAVTAALFADLQAVNQPKQHPEVDLEEFNAGLRKLALEHSQTGAARPRYQPPQQSRFAGFRERIGERASRSMPVIRRAAGAVALVGIALFGGVLSTHGTGNVESVAQSVSTTTTTTFEAPTVTNTIVTSTPEAVITIDLSNAETASALGRLITGNEMVRQSMGPNATEAQIQEAQLRTLDLAVALEAAHA